MEVVELLARVGAVFVVLPPTHARSCRGSSYAGVLASLCVAVMRAPGRASSFLERLSSAERGILQPHPHPPLGSEKASPKQVHYFTVWLSHSPAEGRAIGSWSFRAAHRCTSLSKS